MAESFGLVSNRRAPKRGRKPYMKDLDTMYTDATCYESKMRYPTDQKLLWECCERVYKAMCEASGRLGIRRPRTKSLDVEKANLGYAKQRKHSKSQTRGLTHRLLQMLGKLLKVIRKMEREHADAVALTDKERKTIDIVTNMNNAAPKKRSKSVHKRPTRSKGKN